MYARLATLALLVLAQVLVIVVLFNRTGEYAVSFSSLYRSDLSIATSSDRLLHYYDLSGENNVFVPEWLPYTPLYVRNADRLNDRFDYERPKPPGVFRILTLGDSWTFGLHVSTKDNYAEQLEDMLNASLKAHMLSCPTVQRFEVVNLGLGGYDIEYMVESLRLRGMPYEPNLVIPLIKNDDFVIVNELWQPRIAAYQNEYTDLEARIVDGAVVNPRQEIADRVVREITGQYTEAEINERGIEALRFIDTFYPGHLLLFMYAVSDEQRDRLETFARNRADTYTHIEPLLRPEEKVPHDEHPGASGHRRFAAGLFATLLSQDIVPCESLAIR